MQRTVSLLVVATVVFAVGFAAVGGASGASGVPAGGLEQMDVDADDVLIDVTVEPDGDAVWEIQYRVRLSTDDEEQAFEDLRTDVESDPDAYTNRFHDRMASTAAAAENATGREMAVSNATVTADRRELPQSYGVLTYRFEWRDFAAVDDDRIVIGDAIDGMFLDEASSLIVSWPDGYRLAETSPAPTETREGSVVWRGPVDFTEGQPRATIEPDGVLGGTVPIVAALVVATLVVAVGVAYRRRRDGIGAPVLESVRGVWTDSSRERDGGDASVGSGDSVGPGDSAGEDRPAAGVDGDASVDGAAVRAGSGTSETDDAGASTVDEDLLSNEEQVLRLIESNGGRMKQKRVAEELDWTAAKTSQVVTGLRDDDELDGFRLGRENVLSLPDYDAESAGDAGDDDNGGDESSVDGS
ncbi:helix-turn-helix transcriptional regulator [Halorubrum trueperi]|uniref:Helix-turn-helix transcriptional regulator n=1 Tax=Halorubrum trueperi TaxID=2004704 RepID=A0ABD5UE75_9EURY